MTSGFSILDPCPKRWSELSGDDRQRYCGDCDRHVIAIDQHSREELKKLWRESNGHLCGHIKEKSAAPPRSRRTVLVGALLTTISPLLAQTGRVRIRVTDVTGAVVPIADVSVLGADGKPERTIRTNEAGEVVFTNIPIGDRHFQANATGFKILPLTITVRNADEIELNAVLEIGPVKMGGMILEPKRRRWPFRK